MGRRPFKVRRKSLKVLAARMVQSIFSRLADRVFNSARGFCSPPKWESNEGVDGKPSCVNATWSDNESDEVSSLNAERL